MPSGASGAPNDWPPFYRMHQTNRSWREQGITRAVEIGGLLEWFGAEADEELVGSKRSVSELDAAIQWHLTEAIRAAQARTWGLPLRKAAIRERITSNLDAAEVALLKRAPRHYLRGQVSHIVAHVRLHLPKDDPRRVRVEKLAESGCLENLSAEEKESLVAAVWAASLEARKEFARVRSFNNALLITALILTLASVGAGLWGWLRPNDLPLCFNPSEAAGRSGPDVCPVGNKPRREDVVLVEFVGLLAAAVTGSASLRHVSGTSTRLGLPVALAVLKLPTGALTALLGLMLMRGNVVPGLSALDTSGQILAWAILFGAAQQLVTGLVDRQADNVLNQVGNKTHSYSK
jgi:hypothetical protein